MLGNGVPGRSGTLLQRLGPMTAAVLSHEDLLARLAAMAKRALPEVVDTAVKTYTGYRAVSIIPAVKGGHAVAEMVLVKDGTFTTVAESLD